MLNQRNAKLLQYLCAPISVALAIVARLLLDPLLGAQFPLITAFWAIVFTAWYGGMLPALLAVVLSYLGAAYFVIPLHGTFSIADGEQLNTLLRFIVVGAVTAWLGGSMQKHRLRAEHSAAQAQRQAALIDQVYDAVLVWDWQGTVTFWNRGAEELYGYSRDAALSKHCRELLAPEVTGGIEHLLECLASTGMWEGELSHRTARGERLWVESRMVRITEGERVYVIETNRDITSRRALEQLRSDMQAQLEREVELRTAELAKSEQRYRSLVQATAQLVWRTDANGLPLDATLTEYTGLSAVQIASGDYLCAVSHANPSQPSLNRPSPNQLATAWRAALQAGQAFHCECNLKCMADGRWYDMMVSIVPITNAAGQIDEWMGIGVNISKRKQTERALTASEEQFRVLIEGIRGYAIVRLNPQGVIQTWSKSAERIVGYDADEIIGKPIASLFTAPDVSLGQPAFELAQAQKLGKLEIEGWQVRKNGSQFWASGTLAALRDSEERLTGFVKVMRDLTEKRRNDELLHSVLDNALDAIISIDIDGKISLFSRAGETMFGWSAAEIVGRDLRLLLADTSADDYANLKKYLRSNNTRRLATRREVQGMRKDGAVFPIDIAITGFELDQQRYFICIMRDISERKNLEEQLRQSQKLEAFGQLAGGVAHDFNNLLMVISGYSSLLLSTLSSHEESHKFVSEIHRAGQRAAALTGQLLAFTRQQVLEPRVVDLNSIINDMESMLLRVIGENIQLHSKLAANLGQVKIDPGKVEQVIMNLVVNARDAMPEGGRLTIETAEVDMEALLGKANPQVGGGRFVVLSVADTGSGMVPEIRNRIFEPFFTTKKVGKGTGLGLAVVHGIVKQSGGSIEVQSESGRGTAFRIYLPLARETTAIVNEVDAPAVVNGDETILLVEDDSSVRQLVARSLEVMGYRVLHADSGRSALQLLATYTDKIDLLVTDVVMPEVGGRQVAEAFSRKYNNAKVLFVSGYTNDEVVRHGVLQSEAAFLQKPFTLAALGSKARECLSLDRIAD